jgi:hypothetical protein
VTILGQTLDGVKEPAALVVNSIPLGQYSLFFGHARADRPM